MYLILNQHGLPRLGLLVLATVLHGCSALPVQNTAATAATPVVLVKPDIDFSNETPDCATAGKRLAENVEPGMPLSEVQRLVGKPTYKFPGSWWWSRSIDKTGKPSVRYDFLSVKKEDAVVKDISADISGCPTT